MIAKTTAETPSESLKKPINGSRNLALLGVVAIIIALISSGLSLYVYHSTGDIFLDRSRPGFLPEKPEPSPSPDTIYKFPAEGLVNDKVLDEYLDHFDKAVDPLYKNSAAFDGVPLSDSFLDIPE
jgi:hypothetical protein